MRNVPCAGSWVAWKHDPRYTARVSQVEDNTFGIWIDYHESWRGPDRDYARRLAHRVRYTEVVCVEAPDA
jgi:hypothetical protein